MTELEYQGVERPDVEVIALMDARTSWLGDKRNQLLDLARGDYLTFLNDDDMVVDNWLPRVMALIDEYNGADVFSVQGECLDREEPGAEWRHSHYMATSLEFEGHHSIQFRKDAGKYGDILCHPPAMWCVWKSSVAKQARFGSRTYGEDHDWMMAARKKAKTQVLVREVMYEYYSDDRTSEAGMFQKEYEGYVWAGITQVDRDPGIINADLIGVASEASS